jgi:hypothetical protein
VLAQDRKVLWQITSRSLSYLERLGVVERGPFRPAVQSEIDLTAEQRAALAPFVAIVQHFTAGDPQFPAERRRMALQIVWDEKRFRQLLGKAHAASWSANRYRLQDLAKLVVEVLGQRPAATVSSIHAALVEQHGVRVTQQRTSQVVRALKEAGALIVVNADWPLRYSLAT